ncbi:MAG: hypothetical protein IT359_21565 [Gemmatimonadaceae bacterium]|nr:hypothetical protein [Gemmatimonadaceae bacterium]
MISRFGKAAVIALGLALVGSAPVVASAQTPPVRSLVPVKPRGEAREEVPVSHLPPAGMCRIWIDNVPPAQQPAPTDCASAIKNRPSNGRVIFPEDGARSRKGEGPEQAKGKEKPRKVKRPGE